MSEIEDRRQRAWETYYDSYEENGSGGAAELAIKVATQVKITDEMLDAAMSQSDELDIAKSLFIAAGFEVIE